MASAYKPISAEGIQHCSSYDCAVVRQEIGTGQPPITYLTPVTA